MRHVWDFFNRYIRMRWFQILVLVLASAYIFLELSSDVWLQEGFSWDRPIILLIHQTSTPLLDTIFRVITESVGAFILIPIVIFSFWLWQQHKRYYIVLLIFSVLGMGAMTNMLKVLFQRPRPDVIPRLVHETSYSFPSGHTGAAVSLFGMFGIFLWRTNHRVLSILCWVWVGLVMVSRVYLGAHYPSDVLGSLALGLIWVTLLSMGYPLLGGLVSRNPNSTENDSQPR